MKRLIGNYLIAKVLLATIALSGIGVFAAQNKTISRALSFARPDVRVVIGGTVNRDGQSLSLDKTESVKTGEIIDWTIESTNQGTADAENYRVVGQIPKGTIFVADSVRADNSPAVSYSIDGGKTFAAQPMVEEKQADGTVKKVPAPLALYSQVRFEWNSTLAMQSNLNASYRVRVK